jgi:hypothetical protein
VQNGISEKGIEVPGIDSGCLGPNFSYGHAPSKEDSITLQ